MMTLRDSTNRLIGTRYLLAGRDRHRGLDCVGVVLIVMREVYNVCLPDPMTSSEADVLSSPFFRHFRKLNRHEVRDGDVARYGIEGVAVGHIGIVAGSAVVHVSEKLGVVRTPMDRLKPVAFYRAKELDK